MRSTPGETPAESTSPTTAVLDNVVYTSLMGPHRALARQLGQAVRYPADISGFAALPDQPQLQDWIDLAELTDSEGVAVAEPPGAPWMAVFVPRVAHQSLQPCARKVENEPGHN